MKKVYFLQSRHQKEYMPALILRAMRITVFLTLACVVNLYATGYSQGNTLTLNLKGVKLSEVFNIIQQKTDYQFLYNDEEVAHAPHVNLRVKDATVPEIMAACFTKGYPLSYKIVNKTVVVLPGAVTSESFGLPYEIKLPQFIVKGKVTDSLGNPLVGVTVSLKGSTTAGTITDASGYYSLTLQSGNGVLVFSTVGYLGREIQIRDQTELNVIMKQTTSSLNQLVVVGYSTVKKKDLTGAVSVVNLQEIKNSPAAGVDEMIKGRVPGVSVFNSYAPGGGVAVRIRGFSTIGNNDPLYIIDGVPTTGNLNTIDPNDIASIQILRDASSASIYGSRAANGVVIITTKEGKSGKPEISFNTYTGVQNVFNLPRMLTAQQYGDMLWQATKNDGGTPASAVYGTGSSPVIPEWLDANKTVPSANTNWMKELFHPAMIQSYNLSESRGSQNSHQYFSLGYFDQNGIMKYTGFKRISARINTDTKLFNRLKIGENVALDYTNNTSIGNDNVNSGELYDAFKFPSISPVFTTTGQYAGSPLNDAWNPLGSLHRNKDNHQKNANIFGNVYADLTIIKGLNVRTNFGLNYTDSAFRDYSPKYFELGTEQTQSTLTDNNSYSYNWVWTNTAEYNKTFGRSVLDVLGGMESVKFYNEWFTATRIGFPLDDPNFRFLDAGAGSNQTNTGNALQWSLLSFFGKVNYEYNQTYLASATIRRDGSSKLGNNKWGDFPAFSLGWRISQEPFFHVPFITDLKLRYGWGQNGNQDIPPYATIEGYISDPNNSDYSITGTQHSVETGYIQSRVANPDLKWETTTQNNWGLDASFFNAALQLTVDYFTKNTKDMLIQRPLLPAAGGTNGSYWANAGTMSNKGIEIELSYAHTINEVSFNLAGNFSAYKNRLTSLPPDVPYVGIPAGDLHNINFDQEVSRTYAGHSIGAFYGYEVTGIFQNQEQVTKYQMEPNAQPGDLIFADINGDDVINDKDATFIGSPLPKFTYGFNASLNWRQFDFSFFVQGSYGNKIYDLTRYYGDFFDLSAYNKFSRVLDAWSPGNTHTTIPRLTVNDPNNNVRPSSYYVQNGSYARLKDVELGYTLPKKVIHGNLRIYLRAQNLLTITKYQGMDPEVGLQNYSSASENLDIGVDRGLYPPSRTFIIGVNTNF